MKFTTTAIILSAASLVAAQTPACLLSCYTSSFASTTCGQTDIQCLCRDSAFQLATVACFARTCTSPTEVQAASQLGIQTCAAAGVSLDTAALQSSAAAGASSASGAGSTTSSGASASRTSSGASASRTSTGASSSRSSAGGAASSISSRASSAVSSISSQVAGSLSSVVGGASGIVPSASGNVAPSASPTGAANTLAASGSLLAGALAFVAFVL